MILSVVCVVYCIVLGVGVHSVAIPSPLFYPYGTSNGDTVAPVNDDGSTSAISMSSFPFYASNYTSLFVNTNGAISFDYAFSTYTPASFPLATKMVAPFWSDVDTRVNNGRVYYRVFKADCYRADIRCFDYPPDWYTLDQISHDVKTNCMSSFVGRYMVIVTWQNVTYYGGNAATPTNTFQCALISDGTVSFAIFNYGPITWTTGTASGGSPSTGLGGTPALVGFNADSSHYYSLPASRTANIVNIASTTNVQRSGRYIFRVDQSGIALNCSNKLQLPVGGSTTILRNDNAESTYLFFNRSWAQYQQGFGNPTALYWIGLDRLHQLTQGNCRARFDIQAINGTWFYAQYTTFSVGSSSTKYTLTIGGYSGDAGGDAMKNSNGIQFFTYDTPNACPLLYGGGFWYGDCASAALTKSGPHYNFWWLNRQGFMFLNAVQVSVSC